MCQLLGMNAAELTDFCFSLRGFCQRGGVTDKHSHGWGMCVYQGHEVRCYHDILPACQSPIAKLVQKDPLRTHNMISHIRYATQGEVRLENVHPFTRVWQGIHLSFCHNGDCPAFCTETEIPLLAKTTRADMIYQPFGDTDSEAVFCAILNALSVEFNDGLPSLPALHEFLSVLCKEITGQDHSTIFNFLLGCGPYTLFAYSWPGRRQGSKVWNGLHYLIREPPFKKAKLLDADYEIDFASVTTLQDRVAVITTKPLTEESGWNEFKRGEMILFQRGLPYRTPEGCENLEWEGSELCSMEANSDDKSYPYRGCMTSMAQSKESRKCNPSPNLPATIYNPEVVTERLISQAP